MYGKLGLGDNKMRTYPTPLSSLSNHSVSQIALGSVYSACVTTEGQLFTWGFGGAGNLGLGSRKSFSTPQLVTALSDAKQHIVCIYENIYCLKSTFLTLFLIFFFDVILILLITLGELRASSAE